MCWLQKKKNVLTKKFLRSFGWNNPPSVFHYDHFKYAKSAFFIWTTLAGHSVLCYQLWFYFAVYTVEACIKLLGLGATQYFACYWNTFDFCVTVLGILSLVFEFVGIPLSYIIILRPLRYFFTFFWLREFTSKVFRVTLLLLFWTIMKNVTNSWQVGSNCI
jgi:hypothetical protein